MFSSRGFEGLVGWCNKYTFTRNRCRRLRTLTCYHRSCFRTPLTPPMPRQTFSSKHVLCVLSIPQLGITPSAHPQFRNLHRPLCLALQKTQTNTNFEGKTCIHLHTYTLHTDVQMYRCIYKFNKTRSCIRLDVVRLSFNTTNGIKKRKVDIRYSYKVP